jgi:hypothetical protein
MVSIAVVSAMATSGPSVVNWSQTMASQPEPVFVAAGTTVERRIAFAVDPARIDDLAAVEARIRLVPTGGSGPWTAIVPGTAWWQGIAGGSDAEVLHLESDLMPVDFTGCTMEDNGSCSVGFDVAIAIDASAPDATFELVGEMDVHGTGALPYLDVWID